MPQLTDLIHLVTRTWRPPIKLPGKLPTMIIPSIAEVNSVHQVNRVAAQCRECARLLAVHLFVWRKPYPDKASLKMWSKDTKSFIGMTIEDFQNFLMANFTLKTSDQKEWLCDKAIADRIWQACTATDSPLPLASWESEMALKRKAAR